jgi:hypothetical protein
VNHSHSCGQIGIFEGTERFALFSLMHYPWKAVNMAVESGNWDRKIDNAHKRFKVLTDFHGEAVFDRETDLVWERGHGKLG